MLLFPRARALHFHASPLPSISLGNFPLPLFFLATMPPTSPTTSYPLFLCPSSIASLLSYSPITYRHDDLKATPLLLSGSQIVSQRFSFPYIFLFLSLCWFLLLQFSLGILLYIVFGEVLIKSMAKLYDRSIKDQNFFDKFMNLSAMHTYCFLFITFLWFPCYLN